MSEMLEVDGQVSAVREPALLLGVGEAAALLGIGRSVTYNLMTEGKLRFVKIGTRRLVPRIAVEEYVENLMRSSCPSVE